MHSFGHRANAFLTFALSLLALMCSMASLTDNLNYPFPSASVQITDISRFQRRPKGNEEVNLSMNITADLRSLFTWNTKQVFIFVAAEYETPSSSFNQISLWDAIVSGKEDAIFWVHTANRYRFIDQGNGLRGKGFNLTLHWHVMPRTGKMFAGKIVTPGHVLPHDYK